MDDDKKENFRMEIVKRVWFSQRFNKPCGHLPTNSGHCFGKTQLPTSYQLHT